MKTLVVGVSLGADRYANKAVRMLTHHGHDVVALGLREGDEAGVHVLTGTPPLEGIHTITLYINPARQASMIDYLLSLKPQRIIFNPGTENAEFESRAKRVGIDTVENCTLVLLGSGRY